MNVNKTNMYYYRTRTTLQEAEYIQENAYDYMMIDDVTLSQHEGDYVVISITSIYPEAIFEIAKEYGWTTAEEAEDFIDFETNFNSKL